MNTTQGKTHTALFLLFGDSGGRSLVTGLVSRLFGGFLSRLLSWLVTGLVSRELSRLFGSIAGAGRLGAFDLGSSSLGGLIGFGLGAAYKADGNDSSQAETEESCHDFVLYLFLG